MIRSLAAFLLTLASIGLAVAQGPVLVPSPPTYHEGEHFKGLLLNLDGDEILVYQDVRKGQDGKLYLHMTLTNRHNKILVESVIDPNGWFVRQIIGDNVMTVAKTSCNRRALYPLTIGKIYTCNSVLEVNGRRKNTNDRIEVKGAMRDEQGIVTSVCSVHESQDDDVMIRAKQCHTADGKWLVKGQLVEMTRFEKS